MKKNLVIVEAPGKLKTIGNFLGDDFKIIASVGHFKQLSATADAVQIKDKVEFKWQEDAKKIKNIQDNLSNIKKIYLATDMDREGEAIAWHLQNLIRKKDKTIPIVRISFVEITKKAILKSFENEREVDINLVEAYLTRAGLDHQVGFSISPVLWQKLSVLKNQSAGRVQSPALRALVEKEFERNLFKSMKYYSVSGVFTKKNLKIDFSIEAKLTSLKGTIIDDKFQDRPFLENNIELISKDFIVGEITKKTISIKPEAPFITSSLQQEVHKLLGIKLVDIMKIAQELYEGVNIKGKNTALITYMRTDSTNISQDFLQEIHDHLSSVYPEFKEKEFNLYKSKVKNAQEAHECIRPTYVNLIPESIRQYLNDNQYKVYELIWQRTLASQMIPQKKEQKSYTFENQDAVFSTSNTIILNPGFTSIYNLKNINTELDLKKGEEVKMKSYELKDHETQPPNRFSEASLIKHLEKHGIGRPSTYAGIIEILQKRLYVEKKNKNLVPTMKGEIVCCFLMNFFSKYVDYGFTANVEDNLDMIANGKKNFEETLIEFCNKIYEDVEIVKKIDNKTILSETGKLFTEGNQQHCECGGKLELRMKFSMFLYCVSCDKTIKIGQEENQISEDLKHIKTDTYQYILKNGQKIYLPLKFSEEINDELINVLIELPRVLGDLDNENIDLGMSKYGFFLKHKDKYYTITYNQLMKINLTLATEIISNYKYKYTKYKKKETES